jgi:hypothetical protein
MSPENGNFITHDLGFAAFLKINSYSLISAKRGEKGLFIFEFLDPNEQAADLRLDYINSEFAKFDSEVKGLKKLISP